MAVRALPNATGPQLAMDMAQRIAENEAKAAAESRSKQEDYAAQKIADVNAQALMNAISPPAEKQSPKPQG